MRIEELKIEYRFFIKCLEDAEFRASVEYLIKTIDNYSLIAFGEDDQLWVKSRRFGTIPSDGSESIHKEDAQALLNLHKKRG